MGRPWFNPGRKKIHPINIVHNSFGVLGLYPDDYDDLPSKSLLRNNGIRNNAHEAQVAGLIQAAETNQPYQGGNKNKLRHG
jgi:hypothetical protein